MIDFTKSKPERNTCEKCGRPLPKSLDSSLCPNCQNELLYSEVKDYIINNNVTEFEVADHFDIPLSQVRKWVEDGRIEYRK